MGRLLLTWSDRGAEGPTPGHHGPRPAADEGPVLRLLSQPESRGVYHAVRLLVTTGGVIRARRLAAEIRERGPRVDVSALDVDDPSDHESLFSALGPVLSTLPPGELDVLLSAGTPQMQTLWVVLVKAGLLPARMLQVIPAVFVPRLHRSAVREVSLDFEGFPEIRSLRDEVARLRGEAVARTELVAESAGMREVVGQIGRVGPTALPILVQGETGSGKELVARALHRASARAAGPFVAENVGALDPGTLASELFGHERGAYTGAEGRRRGLFELAHGGTLFLDEVGELPPRVQVSLLRVLQEGTLRRVGGEATVKVDVRIVAATHRNLREAVAARAFREDLYYRLNGATLRIPPLRDRPEDVEPLVLRFLAEAGRPRLHPVRETWRALLEYRWPGNVRELRAEVLRWTVFCDTTVKPSDLSPEVRHGTPAAVGTPPAPPPLGPLAPAVAALEKGLLERALAESGGNLSGASRTLRIDRNTLKRKIAALGIRTPRGR